MPGDLIEIKRNDTYWGASAEWDNILIRPIKDGTTRTAALISGDVDFIERVPPSDLPNVEGREGLSVFKSVSNRLLYVTLHMTDDPIKPHVTDLNDNPIASPFEDIRVRKAVSLAINRKAIADRVMDGLAAPAGQFSPMGYIGYSKNLKADGYDPDRAKELMVEAGYTDGFKLTMQWASNGPAGRYTNDTRILEAIAQMLSRIGIDTSVETMPASVFFKRFARGGVDKKPEFTAANVGICKRLG